MAGSNGSAGRELDTGFLLPSGRSTNVEGSLPSVSVQEQQIIAEIQELQRQLWKIKTETAEGAGDEDGGGDAAAAAGALESGRRVVMASNRLPISAERSADGEWTFRKSSGGLVSALKGVKEEYNFLWIGWVGCDVDEDERPRVTEQLLRDFQCYPVFLDEVRRRAAPAHLALPLTSRARAAATISISSAAPRVNLRARALGSGHRRPVLQRVLQRRAVAALPLRAAADEQAGLGEEV